MNTIKLLFFSLSTLLVFTQCQKEEETSTKGQVQFEITDAPIDDAHVKGVFVTIAEVKIDGETFEGFSGKQTIDIAAYQNGNTEILGLSEMEASSYTNITLVLDYEKDDQGNSPGCYVLNVDDEKESLSDGTSSTVDIVISGTFDVKEEATTKVVADFDLRKSIRHEAGTTNKYSFVTKSEMDKSIRLVNKEESGTVKGKCNDNVSDSDKIVVFAYAKGQYNRETELEGQGSSDVTFANATSSTVVKADGSYHLAFLNEGDYELVFVSYKDTNSDGSFELNGTLQFDLLLGLLNTVDVSVEASATVSLDLDVSAVLGL